jgi:transcriptional regulator with XRE-family HTH domain
MFDRIAIGRRIVQARLAQGFNTPAALAKAIQEKIASGGKKPTGRTLARQTVENWEKGRHVPPWEKVELMARVFRPEHNEEFIMFGERRAEQLIQDRSVLARISDEEVALLQLFRETSEQGRKSILASAKGIAEDHPAPEAVVHNFRRVTDQQH